MAPGFACHPNDPPSSVHPLDAEPFRGVAGLRPRQPAGLWPRALTCALRTAVAALAVAGALSSDGAVADDATDSAAEDAIRAPSAQRSATETRTSAPKAAPAKPPLKNDGSRSRDPQPAPSPEPRTRSPNGDLSRPALYVGLQAYSPALMKYSSSPDGRAGAFSRFAFPLNVGIAVPVAERFRVLPQIGWNVLWPNRHPEGHGSTDVLLIRAPVAFAPTSSTFEVTGGIAYKEVRSYGDGGAVSLNNALSTAQFAAPGDARSARGLMFEIGAQGEFSRVSAGAAFTAEALLNESRRTFGFWLFVSYRAWEFEWR